MTNGTAKRLDIRTALYDPELIEGIERLVREQYKGQYGAMAMIVRLALVEYVPTEGKKLTKKKV